MSESTTTTQVQVEECKRPYARKVKGGGTKTYKCNKPKGHEGPHGRTTNVAPLVVAPATVDSFEFVPGTDAVALVTRERSPEQVRVDEHVRRAYDAWVAAGKPRAAKDSPQVRYFVTAAEVEDMRKMIRRGAEFHSKRAQIGPPVKHQDGRFAIHYRVTDRAEKPSEVRSQDAEDRATASAPAESGQAVSTPAAS